MAEREQQRPPAAGLRGRGAASNPPNRFARLHYVREADDPAAPAPPTQFFRDASRSIISCNDSPDVGFEVSINPYRGCEHGCIYCFARPTHEYLGFSAGLDFETKILVKEDAPVLLERALASPRWQPRPLALSGVTDPYQPVERRLQLTRRCLQVLVAFRQPVVVVTKSALVTRDLDLLQELARVQAAAVYLSITTLDETLCRLLEPRASQPPRRLAALTALAAAGIPAGVLVAPVIPGLTEHELPAILAAAARAGARFAGYSLLRLPHAVAELFQQWLEQHFPARKAKVLGRLRALRGGALHDTRFGTRLRGEGLDAEQLAALFRLACRKSGLSPHAPALSSAAFRRPTTQLSLFAP
ncbi:MAG: radical SAM protein [Candidatus Tectimicrobiota bacterium]|nr:MAG: radical SAM protein [Candidatus Tectomicrobia bacterium]